MAYSKRDEMELRDKLVSRLKDKEVAKMSKIGERIKKRMFDDQSMDEISDEDLEVRFFAHTPRQSFQTTFEAPT